MDLPSQDLRSQALQRIASLCASAPPISQTKTLAKLHNRYPRDDGATESLAKSSTFEQKPMTVSELESLLALCKAATLLSNVDAASNVLEELSTRLVETPHQIFTSSPPPSSIIPSPHEVLTFDLTNALLIIGTRHPTLHSAVLHSTSAYLRTVTKVAKAAASYQKYPSDSIEQELHGKLDVAGVTLSLIGFIDSVSKLCDFFTAGERLDLLEHLRRIFAEDFMVAVEGVFSSIRTSGPSAKALGPWKLYTKRYAAAGRPLGAMLLQNRFMRFVVSCSSLQICAPAKLRNGDVFEVLLSNGDMVVSEDQQTRALLIGMQSDIATESMRLLDDGSDYLQLGSAWQQQLAFATKAYTLQVFLNCMVLDEDVADPEVLIPWLEDAIADSVQMADSTLATTVLQSMAVVARFSPPTASTLSRSLPRFIVQSGVKGETVIVAARSLTHILRLLSQDAVITGLYSLGNVLSARSNNDRGTPHADVPNGTIYSRHTGQYSQHSTGSAISLDLSGEEETTAAYSNVVRAIVAVANTCKDEKITALAQTMLIQKLNKVSTAVDIHIITEAARLSLSGGPAEFSTLLKFYTRLVHKGVVESNTTLLASVRVSQSFIAKTLRHDSPLFPIFLVHLLETIVSKGDVHESHNSHGEDVDIAAREIVELIPVLANLVSVGPGKDVGKEDEYVGRLYREAWFNIIVHGIVPGSTYGERVSEDLRTLANQTHALIADDRAEYFESEIELNSVLRRGMNAPNTAEQKKRLIKLLPRCESDIRGLSYPKVVFLSATYLVETSRAASGDCSQILTYFLDPSLNGTAMEGCMSSVAEEAMTVYLKTVLTGPFRTSSAPQVAQQLATMLSGCCHRIPRVQQVANLCVDRIINQVPSALCQKSSLFALLELLTLMWTSCLEAELDEYELRANYSSSLGKVSIELSDDYDLRRRTLDAFYKRAIGWVTVVINIAPMDVRGLFQTYLSEYDDEGTYGHVSLGRTFAVEMGSLIPATDQKLGAIDRQGQIPLNTASDFVAQYTTRQEYKYADVLPSYDKEWARFLELGDGNEKLETGVTRETNEDEAILTHLGRRALDKKFSSIGELRDLLRRAAALLCRSKRDQCGIIQYLVELPFAIFTKQSIKLGISLWLGVINENPSMEPRILAVIAEEWEKSVRGKLGAFSSKLSVLDPFYLKEEFAASDKALLMKKQQAAQNLIAPHLRILQFLSSHFNASRLGSPHIQRIFHRLIKVTLEGLKHSAGNPLARELHFRCILLGINCFRYGTGLDSTARWRLKDSILSAGLSWFYGPPQWSFGGNRLQIKAEVKLMADVEASLRAISSFFVTSNGTLHSLASKQELLTLLIENEQVRLVVWLYPLDHEKRHFFSHGSGKPPSDATLTSLAKFAWVEHPGLTIQLANRFASEKLANDVRSFLLRQPDLALDEPDALQIMIGAALPGDVTFQLKYLLYWAPVSPVTAVTYFLPEFKNHPFVVQYGMRALESHSVDVTFFYVPQIVQTLRYDVLGYVQRYILETAKFSQLFAHQIIWNMTANAYKDEDSTVEDSLKPTLDTVKNRMIASFSGADKAFYEREFSFFDEVTGISGKLRPFIKKTKPEKKQKIEEELRKITVEVGVYLPSNPDGTVIGIDRKSGKPLQSHAKAPFMATFRIRRNKTEIEYPESALEETGQTSPLNGDATAMHETTYEVWQSAIFKVGDDCRQDVLALQMIAAFRGIFNNVGLDVYVYPYRVTATAPGCGVIDVLPNSISRDMLGREAVNGLYDYFVSKYGAENSIRFQEARNNFVKSMAAYSVISYLLQFKDRHNGNIMIDDAGHILHIDFGFCFDIAPGGVRFERAPFKLTSEMVAVMGGNTSSQSYKWFEELCIKAFLASRPHAEKLCHIVVLMLGSGLPCFKPETIAHLRQRFVLEKTEREAADFMRDLIRKSYGSYSTKGYDQFQLLTNGIPY